MKKKKKVFVGYLFKGWQDKVRDYDKRTLRALITDIYLYKRIWAEPVKVRVTVEEV